MTITIAGKQTTGAADLSATAQLVLGFIDGGNEWLAYAVSTPAPYAFPDELALLTGVQQGLHGALLTLLPGLGLLASPARLFMLSASDLSLLTAAEGGADAPEAELRTLLATQQLATAADLAAADAWLASLGVADAPLFQALSLADRIELVALENEAGGEAEAKDAGAFALSWAKTPLEFADYFRAFIALRAAAPSLTGEALATALLGLLPHLFGTLDCPSVGGIKPAAEITAAIRGWHASGRQIGFARLSLAAAQIAASTGFGAQPGADDPALIAAYMAQAQAVIGNGDIGSGRLGQDGASALFDITSDTGDAQIAVDAAGTISLHAFRPAPAAAA
ncbi:hypothetical protein [Sphingomonas sp. G-3-2-10]|uniref:hypothetical protein n=1 Tax=Sphingomonas sp. G-3-2-10 TaxID=2728838 RepID=UPI00146B03C1|nr:hypothetical protein [Sphingomonas sp. G-3-2-10]NML05992.1 hypothetical protein [Sphingomonas sp. G-3-2-10]